MAPAVTWLLPVKNGMPFLPETLASIEAQTYRDWQVLAWDNGSTDGTVEELNRWIPSRLPGRVVTGNPLPLGDSLRELVRECETEYCARIDADDVNEPHRLERQMAYLDAHPAVGALGTHYTRINERGDPLPEQHRLPLEHWEIVPALLYINPLAHPTMLMRRAAILAAGNYRTAYPVSIEDYDLWLRMASRCDFANLPESLLRYRVHSGSVTQQALHADRLYRHMHECLAVNGPDLFGCSDADLRALSNRSHPKPMTVVRRIARHLASLSGKEHYDPMKSKAFLVACKHLMGRGQIVPRLTLFLLDPDKRSVFARRLHRAPQ